VSRERLTFEVAQGFRAASVIDVPFSHCATSRRSDGDPPRSWVRSLPPKHSISWSTRKRSS
jgi:hypothetical protein